jgi:endonuclease/exonuclease/phosphatase family metal-dependent hydrolase
MQYGNIPAHIAQGLQVLRKRIDQAKIPSSKLDESLVVATWNVRDFGKRKRSESAIHYIAEILSQFDLIGLVELRDDLTDLGRVLDLLGPNWKAVFSDFVEDDAGNHERIAFVYDTRMVRMTGLAAEANPPRKKNAAGEYQNEFSWWRAPYMVSFEAGSFDFVVMATHTRYTGGVAARTKEIQELREWIERRLAEPFVDDRDVIVMGDFNIPSRASAAYKALIGDGKTLVLPKGLLGVKGTTLSQDNTYDQIVHSATPESRFTDKGGVLDYFRGDWEALYPDKKDRPGSQQKFTFELSDHLPLWIEVRTDIQNNILQILSGQRAKRSRPSPK